MARSKATSDGANQHELQTIALIGGRRDVLWQLADEAGGHGPENLSTVVADQGLTDQPVDVRVRAFAGYIEEQLQHNHQRLNLNRLEQEYGNRADEIVAAARQEPTQPRVRVTLRFPAGDSPEGTRKFDRYNVAAVEDSLVSDDNGPGDTVVHVKNATTGHVEKFRGADGVRINAVEIIAEGEADE